jgi:N-acetylmuramoyl-L-alanine amidase
MGRPNMRSIRKIIIHCADTPASMDIGAEEIRRWHTDPPPKGRGWSDIGYHHVIRRDGTVEAGRAHEVAGAHVISHNSDSIGVCMVGGRGKDNAAEANFTRAQWAALERLVGMLTRLYPDATVHGHNEFSSKACPAFNVQAWWDK